jgi:glycosyltransferase involved in cell wall biosynthesis
VLHIINVCFVGKFGLADYTLSLARALSRFGRSEIVTSQGFDYPDVHFDGVVTKIFRRSRHYPVDIFKFVFYILKVRPDVLIFQSVLKLPFVDGLVVRVLRACGVRIFATVHDVLPHHPRLWSRIEYSFFYKSFDGLIAHSEDAKRQLLAFGVRSPIEVVPHGVYDIYKLDRVTREQAREKLGFQSNDFVALFFGLIDPRKGVEFLVELVERGLLPAGIKLMFAGRNGLAGFDAVLDARFERMLKSDQCASLVREISFEEVEQVFKAADVVLLPYKEGTTSGVLKLAVAFDRPVVASKIGDIPSNVAPGTGIIFDMADPPLAISDALSSIRSDYLKYVDECRSSGAEFSWERVGKAYFDFVSRV